MATPKNVEISASSPEEVDEIILNIPVHVQNAMGELSRHECDVAGCIAHRVQPFECHKNGNVELDMVKYHARIHFKSVKELVDAAAESIKRKLASIARNGKFPTNRIVNVDIDGKFELTMADRKEQYQNMSASEKAEFKKAAMAMLAITEDK